MLKPSKSSTSLRPHHGLLIAGGIVAAVLIAYVGFSFVVGTIAVLVKLAIVIGIAYLVVRLVVRSARR